MLTFGGVVHCTRAFYYCRSCGQGLYPWDDQVGLTKQRTTPAVNQLTSLCGAVADSFGKGADLLAKTAGVRLSEATVQRTTEAVGERLRDQLNAGHTFGPKTVWPWYRDALGDTIGYLSIDSTGVPQQGPHGAKADGRMAYVGMIFNPLPDRERVFEGLPKKNATMDARYVCGLYPLAEMGPLLRQQAAQVGLDEVTTWVALSDGGVGLEAFLRMNFPRVEAVILDFYHASEYVAKLAQALHPTDDTAATEQTRAWCQLLQAEGGDVLLSVWEEWSWPSRKGLPAVRAEVLGYFQNQRHRMDYPTYEANGWYIGSGAVESACKTVVNQRLKGTGMRWSEQGGDAVCHVRALYRSEASQWEAFWNTALAA